MKNEVSHDQEQGHRLRIYCDQSFFLHTSGAWRSLLVAAAAKSFGSCTTLRDDVLDLSAMTLQVSAVWVK
jgi:hypothetical protein